MTRKKDVKDLAQALSSLAGADEIQKFLLDLCTPAELSAMADRWKAARLLKRGLPYREIYERTGVSTATVTRVARSLTSGAGGYQLLLDRLQDSQTEKPSPHIIRIEMKP